MFRSWWRLSGTKNQSINPATVFREQMLRSSEHVESTHARPDEQSSQRVVQGLCMWWGWLGPSMGGTLEIIWRLVRRFQGWKPWRFHLTLRDLFQAWWNMFVLSCCYLSCFVLEGAWRMWIRLRSMTCEFCPGSGNLIVSPGKAKEHKENRRGKAIQGLNFSDSILYTSILSMT